MLTRGMPLSVLVHALALVLLLVYGNRTAQQAVQPPRSINVKLVQLPQSRPQEQPVQQPDPEPEPARQETQPELPPKELPKPKPETVKPKPQEPKPREQQPETKPEAKPETQAGETRSAATAGVAALSGPSVSATDSDFPFAWYIALVESKVAANFKPKQMGFGKRTLVSCTVHFNIMRNGRVAQVTLVRNSGLGLYDRLALSAVQSAKLPPLPAEYRASELGVTFVFNTEPGS